MIDEDTESPLVARVKAFEQLQRAEQYLFGTTYASDGHGTRSWSQWYEEISLAVDLLRDCETDVRLDLIQRLGAIPR